MCFLQQNDRGGGGGRGRGRRDDMDGGGGGRRFNDGGGDETTFIVPADKTGLVIGRGKHSVIVDKEKAVYFEISVRN